MYQTPKLETKKITGKNDDTWENENPNGFDPALHIHVQAEPNQIKPTKLN